MDFMELVRKRCSVRKYDSRPLKREDINSCLEAARLAPSACNSQPWNFIIVAEPVLKEKVAEAMLRGIYGNNTFVRQVPVLVAVVTEKSQWFTRVANFLRDTKMYCIDLGIAGEHFILRAAELGIGTCWLGWFNERQVKKALGIPKHKRIDVMISMGYPASEFIPPEKNRKAINEMSSFA